MNKQQLERYHRHLLLPELGEAGQESLLRAQVLIVGAGGLGSIAAIYLAAAGVGKLLIYDGDRVDLSNLQRQIAHRTADIGRLKAESVCEAVLALNPTVEAVSRPRMLREPELSAVLANCDLVIDACDNFATRFALNRACLWAGVPLISGAVGSMRGQVTTFTYQENTPCYNCLYPENGEESDRPAGILAPLPGAVGILQAIEAIRLLSGGPNSALSGRLLKFEAIGMDWKAAQLLNDPDCPTCGHTSTIPMSMVSELLAHMQSAPEHEICGLLGAAPGPGVIPENLSYYPIANIAPNPDVRFQLDPAQQIAALRLLRERRERLYAVYHSHPNGPTTPSAADLEEATVYPGVLLLLGAQGVAGLLELSCFRLQAKKARQLKLELA